MAWSPIWGMQRTADSTRASTVLCASRSLRGRLCTVVTRIDRLTGSPGSFWNSDPMNDVLPTKDALVFGCRFNLTKGPEWNAGNTALTRYYTFISHGLGYGASVRVKHKSPIAGRISQPPVPHGAPASYRQTRQGTQCECPLVTIQGCLEFDISFNVSVCLHTTGKFCATKWTPLP